ncbi:GGDEF domain-containing protein [Actinoplanes sp. NPDC026619]|uniref:GGDEF domain-containing protein n=1 Tax=Actinoplanes sp. NPDC026619 TaxID=3155798 RepID=UPI0033E92EFF
MSALIRRDPLRSLRLLFLTAMVVVGAVSLLQVQLAHVSRGALAISAAVIGAVFLLRVAEFRLGALVPFLIDILELAAVAVMLSQVRAQDPVVGPIFFILMFRAATGRLRRVLPMIAGYIGVCVAGFATTDIRLPVGLYIGMVIIPSLVYAMRSMLQRMQIEQQRHEDLLADVLTRLPFPVIVTGPDGAVVLANPAAGGLTGPLDGARAELADGTAVDLRRLAPGESGLELRITRADGRVVEALAETVPTMHGTILALLDVTAQRDYEHRLEHAAFHDPLTGLPNRAQLWRQFAEAADDEYAVLLVDLDGFKAVNDTYGHLAGDELLCRVAERLRHVCGPEATVARLGGDEFAALLPHTGAGRATEVATAIRECFGWEVPLSTGPVRVGGSVGCALGGPGFSPDHVLAEADAAMYAEKHARVRN